MGFGWRTACLVLLPLPVALFAIFARITFPSVVSDEQGRIPLRKLLKEKWFLGAMVAIFLGGATELGMAQWLPAYAESALGFPQWISGVGLLLFSVAMAAGRMVVGAFGTRLNPFHTMAWGCGSSVILFLAGSFLPIYLLALTACVLVGFTGSCLWPTNAGSRGWVAGIHNLHVGLAVSALAPLLMLPLVFVLGRLAQPSRLC